MNLGENLQRAIDARQLKPAQLARKMGVTRSQVHQLLHHESNPRLSTLKRAAGALEMSVAELLEDFPSAPASRRRRHAVSKRRRAA